MASAPRIYPCHAFTSLDRSQPSMVSFLPTCSLRNGLESAGITTAMRCNHHHHSITISSVLSIQSRGCRNATVDWKALAIEILQNVSSS
jgi:hypothetical protein